MNVIFVSSRGRGRQGQRQQNRIGVTVNITVPSDLVLRLHTHGAILQMQIGPVPLRPDLARPTSRPDSGRSSRPDSGRQSRPTSRPDSGRSSRPNRTTSRQPNLSSERPISPFMDWSSLGEMPTRLDLEEAEVISIDSESGNDYVPPEPMYKPGSPRPEPVEEAPENPRPGPSREEGAPNIFTKHRERAPSREGAPNIPDSARRTESEPSREEGAPNIFTDSTKDRERASNDFDNSARPRVFRRGIGIPGVPVQHVSPFFRGTGNRRNFLGRVGPM